MIANYVGARVCFQRVLAILELFQSADHPNIQIVGENLESLQLIDQPHQSLLTPLCTVRILLISSQYKGTANPIVSKSWYACRTDIPSPATSPAPSETTVDIRHLV